MKRAFSRKNLWENLPQGLKSSIGQVAGLVPAQFILGGDYRRWRERALAADSWSREQVQTHLLNEVRSICQLAATNSAYYQQVFADAGFDPHKMTSTDELDVLPLIDKHVINQHQDDMLCTSKDEPGIDYVATGGSSGEPLRFLIGADRSAPEFAHLSGSWERIGYTVNTPLASLRGQVIPPDGAGLHRYYDPLLRRHNYSNFYMNDESMAGYLDHIATIGDCFIHTYPSSLNMLVRFIRRTGHPVPKNIKGLLIGSENVYAEDREIAEEVFGVRFFSWYGHSEKLVFAAECEHVADYHVNPTYGYCELVDEAGNRVTEPGGRGEIVGTGFINRVMPFIRYRTGDYATYLGDHCSHCGRNFMMLGDISGHNLLEVLVAKDGSLIPWAACNVHDDTFDAVLQFQFRQTEIGSAMLRIVPSDPASPPPTGRIVDEMNKRLQGQLHFEIEVVDEIPLTTHGKSVFVDQQLDVSNL